MVKVRVADGEEVVVVTIPGVYRSG